MPLSNHSWWKGYKRSFTETRHAVTYHCNINMHKRNQSTRRPGNRGEARPASPALTRSRAAALGTEPPPPTEEADDQAAIIINPPEAGGGAATADSDGSLSTDGADSDAGSAIDADAAAADAAASRRRTEARLQQLEESQPALSPGHAASQFAARGVEMLGNPPTDSVEVSGELVGAVNPDLPRGTLGDAREDRGHIPLPIRGLPARTGI